MAIIIPKNSKNDIVMFDNYSIVDGNIMFVNNDETVAIIKNHSNYLDEGVEEYVYV